MTSLPSSMKGAVSNWFGGYFRLFSRTNEGRGLYIYPLICTVHEHEMNTQPSFLCLLMRVLLTFTQYVTLSSFPLPRSQVRRRLCRCIRRLQPELCRSHPVSVEAGIGPSSTAFSTSPSHPSPPWPAPSPSCPKECHHRPHRCPLSVKLRCCMPSSHPNLHCLFKPIVSMHMICLRYVENICLWFTHQC
jgi:hypothetical protein